jgi:hypothetical protein
MAQFPDLPRPNATLSELIRAGRAGYGDTALNSPRHARWRVRENPRYTRSRSRAELTVIFLKAYCRANFICNLRVKARKLNSGLMNHSVRWTGEAFSMLEVECLRRGVGVTYVPPLFKFSLIVPGLWE